VIPLFVELCAGTAAISLALHAAPRFVNLQTRPGARPPVSRMGSKAGYAEVILRVIGLRLGQGAAHYLWCEPDAGCRLLLHAYRDPALARAAAEIIRGWRDEEPRALWDRLRAEGPPRLGEGAREVARWCYVASAAFRRGQPESGYRDDVADVKKGTRWGCTHQSLLVGPALTSTPHLPASIHPDALTINPREVARWTLLGLQSYKQGQPESGFRASAGGDWPDTPPRAETAAEGLEAVAAGVDPREVARWVWGTGRSFAGINFEAYVRTTVDGGAARGLTPRDFGRRIDALPHLPASILPDALPLHPPQLPEGTVVYADPSYVGTTSYADNLSRADVVMLARRWHTAGARVVISEAEPIPELIEAGWYAVEITDHRRGQKRTFSKQTTEFLTLSHPPADDLQPRQAGLFGAPC